MSERSERLQQAMRAANLTQAEAVERFHWNRNTLKSNLNGAVDYSYKRAMVYAGRLRVRAEWLYSGEGPMTEPPKTRKRPDREVPVIAWVAAGQLADIGQVEEIGALEQITVSGLAEGEYFATDVHGDSMDRVSPDGSRIIVRVDRRYPTPGGFYLFSLDGQTTYKRFYDDPVPRLEPFSTNPENRPIYLSRDNWQVVGIVARSMIDLG